MVGQNINSVPNIPGLNPKYLRSAYDVKAYVVDSDSSVGWGR